MYGLHNVRNVQVALGNAFESRRDWKERNDPQVDHLDSFGVYMNNTHAAILKEFGEENSKCCYWRMSC